MVFAADFRAPEVQSTAALPLYLPAPLASGRELPAKMPKAQEQPLCTGVARLCVLL